MRSLSRSLSLAVLPAALLACLLLTAAPARAGEDERPRRPKAEEAERQIRALKQAIEVLRRNDGDERVIRGLAEAIERMRRDAREQHERDDDPDAREHRERARRAERQIVEHWLEVMGLAKRTLAAAERGDATEIVEHGMHALELALKNRRDEEAMRVRNSAPSRAAQAKALFLAAEILAKHDKAKESRWVAEVAKAFRQQAERRARERADKDDDEDEADDDEDEDREDERAERRALKRRVATIRMAVPVLREAGDERLVGLLERAILTGDLMLAGREDEEARRAFERTPSLGELAEILHHAARLADKQGKGDRAERIMELSRYYAERWKAQQAEREEHERRQDQERKHRDPDAREHERARHLEELQEELHHLRERLERLQRALEEVTRRK